MKTLQVILAAIVLPSLLAMLHLGASLHFWLSAGLCFLGGLPGLVVHALWLLIT